MEFFDKLGETISSKSKDVAKKAREIAEVATLNGKISAHEEAIRKAYIELGQKYYEKYKLDLTNEFGLDCETITRELDEILKIKSEIQTIKNYKICSRCGAEEAADAVFCSKCGLQFEIVSEESAVSDEEPTVLDEEDDVLDSEAEV